MDKQKILEKVVTSLKEEIKLSQKTADNYHRSALEAPGAMQSHSDTTKFEMELARDKVLNSLKKKNSELVLLEKFSFEKKGNSATLGDLVCIRSGSKENKFLFLLPGGASIAVEHEGMAITAITPESPLGSAINGKNIGHKFTLGAKNWEIIQII